MKDLEKLLQDITIYHKEATGWIRYNIKASVRNVSTLNRDRTGTQTSDNTLIRVFNVEGYNNTWKCKNGDIIYSGNSNYNIIEAPLTELRNLYGKEKVYEVSSVQEFIFEDENIKEINHIKIGAR